MGPLNSLRPIASRAPNSKAMARALLRLGLMRFKISASSRPCARHAVKLAAADCAPDSTQAIDFSFGVESSPSEPEVREGMHPIKLAALELAINRLAKGIPG